MKSFLTYRVYFPVRNVVRTGSCSQVLGDQKRLEGELYLGSTKVACFFISYSTIQRCLIKLQRIGTTKAQINSGKCFPMSPSLFALSLDQFKVCISMSE